MRKVILNLAVTLDGFIEGPNGEIDWLVPDSGAAPESDFESHFDEFLKDIDSIFYGRVSYEMWGNYQPAADASPAEKKLWNGVHSKRKYVFSKSLTTLDSGAELINSDLPERVREIKSRKGKDIWLYGGASLITTFINLQLVDTYLLAVYPVILGAGKPLFSAIKDRVNLSLKNLSSNSNVILLEYDAK